MRGKQAKKKKKQTNKQRKKETVHGKREGLQEVGVFSYFSYSCLRAIQWPWGLALTVGLVHDSLE